MHGWYGRETRRPLLLVVVSAVVLLLMIGSVTVAQQSREDQQKQNQQQQQDQQRQNQNQQNQNGQNRMTRQNQQTEYLRVNDLTGATVYGQRGEEIGSFENIVLDENRQRVLYAVVAEGGFLGIGDNLHAVPWQWVSARAGRGVTLSITKDQLTKSPKFDQYPTQAIDQAAAQWADNPPSPQEWSTMRFQTDGREVDSDDPNFRLRKATELIGMDVVSGSMMQGNQFGTGRYNGGIYDDDYGYDDRYGEEFGYNDPQHGQPAGEIEDLLISKDGTLDFALVQTSEEYFGIGEDEFVAVPWARVIVYPETEFATLDATQQEVQNLVISEEEINRLNEPNFRDRFFTTVGVDYYTWVDEVQRGNQFDGNQRRFDDNQRGRQPQQQGQRQQQGQMQQQEARQWSNFAQQCLGRNFQGDETIEGTVTGFGRISPSRNAKAPAGQSFTVTTQDNERMTVYLGPNALIPREFNVERGSQVTVEGAQCDLGGRDVFVAAQIEADGQTFNLTQRNGTPHWESQSSRYGQQGRQPQRGREQQRGQTGQREENPMQKWSNFTDQCLGGNLEGDQTIRGEVRSIGTLYTPPNSPAPDGRRFTVQTNNQGRVTVFAGPNQVAAPLSISRGEQVTIRGTQCQVNGRDVLVATRIEAGGQVFTLQDQRGTPQWTPQDKASKQQEGNRR